MSNEIQIIHDDGAETVYAIVRETAATGRWYDNTTDHALETFDSANWATYAITLAQVDVSSPPTTGNAAYQGAFPALAAGFYWLDVYVRAGATAAQTDYRVCSCLWYWDATDLVPAGGAADARQINASAPAAANVASVFLGTGHTDDVDLTARNLHILSDTDHAVRFESTRANKDGLRCMGAVNGQSNIGGNAGQYNSGTDIGQSNFGGNTGQSNYGGNNGQRNYGSTADVYLNGTGTITNSSGNVIRIGSAAALAAYNTTGVAKEASVGAIATILAGITSLAAWLRGIFRKDTINATALSEINAIHDGGAAGTFSATTDSNEAIRDNQLAAGAKMDLADSLNQTGVTDLKTKLGTIPASGDWNTVTPDAAGTLAAYGPVKPSDLADLATAAGVTAATAPLATATALATVDTVVDAIGAKTALIGTNLVTYASWVADGGSRRIYAGEDFLAADGRGLAFTVTDYAGPALASATGSFKIIPSASYDDDDTAATLSVAATIAVSGTTIIVSADLTAAQTGALATSPAQTPLNYVFQYWATLSNGHKVLLVQGRMTVAKAIA